MPNLLEKAKDTLSNGVKAITRGTFKLSDPGNVDSQFDRGDLADSEQELNRYLYGSAKAEGNKLVELGGERYEEARLGRWRHHGDFYTGIAFYKGLQYSEWDSESGQMVSVLGNPDFDERFIPKYENVVRVMVERAVARITAAYPDAWAAPLTDDPRDKKAAQIHRAVNAHCFRLTNRQRMLRDAVLAMLISTTCFIEVGWEAKAWADVGLPQPDGSVKYEKAQIGDVHNALMLAIDAYPDPNAALTDKGIHGGAYFVKRCLRSITFIQKKWGVTVKATAPGDTYGSLEQRLEYIAGDQSRQKSQITNCTEVTEVWELPSEQYKDGRFWVYSADKTMLHAGKWPYEKRDKYPFVAFNYGKNFGSVWGLNMVKDLIPDQRTLNRLATYLANRLEWDRPVQYIPDNCEIAPEDLISPHYAQNIPYRSRENGGSTPTWAYPPPPGDFYFALEKSLLQKMELIAGVHDFNADQATPPNSGYEFELRMQTDKERLSPVIRHICENVVEIDEWDGALYEQFGASFPRLLGLDDRATPAKDLEGQGAAAAALVDIQALKDGNCRVVYQPGSGESKLPAAQEEQLQDIVKALKDTPPPLVEFYLSESQAIRSDAEKDRLITGLNEYAAQQAQQAAQVQQMKGDQAQQQLSMKAQQEQQAAQIQLQADGEKAAIQAHGEMLSQQWRAQSDSVVENQRFQNSMALLQAKGSTPAVSISVKAGGIGTKAAEELAGFPQTDDPAKVDAMNKPVPAAQKVAGKPSVKSANKPS